jgi:hypothetical protein
MRTNTKQKYTTKSFCDEVSFEEWLKSDRERRETCKEECGCRRGM